MYGSTDTVKEAVLHDPLVERCLRHRGGSGSGGAGLGLGSSGTEHGFDPEDEESSAGVAMGNMRCGTCRFWFGRLNMSSQSEAAHEFAEFL